MLVQHSSKTNEYYTPPYLAEAIRDFLGGIDLDPASCEEANKVIGATRYYSQALDGLSLPWGSWDKPQTVFCNPPGGKVNNKSQAKMFWQQGITQRLSGHLKEAVFLFFNPNILQTSQHDCHKSVTDFPICFLDHRVKYLDQSGQTVDSPPGISLLVYLPGAVDRRVEFAEAFISHGETMFPV
jgi:hypothetical protein